MPQYSSIEEWLASSGSNPDWQQGQDLGRGYEPEDPNQNSNAGWDTVTDLKKGVYGLAEGAAGLADLAAQPFHKEGDSTFSEDLANSTYGRWNKEWDNEYSDARKQSDKEVQQAIADSRQRDGELASFGTAVSQYATHWRSLLGTVAQSAPSFMAGAGAGGVAAKGAAMLGRSAAAVGNAARAGASVGEGLLSAGQSASQIVNDNVANGRSATQGINYAGLAGLSTGLVAHGAGKIGGNVEAGVFAKEARPTAGRFGRIKATLGEGTEELLQAPGETIPVNLATDKTWNEGVGENMGSGLVAGASMGFVGHRKAKPVEQGKETDLLDTNTDAKARASKNLESDGTAGTPPPPSSSSGGDDRLDTEENDALGSLSEEDRAKIYGTENTAQQGQQAPAQGQIQEQQVPAQEAPQSQPAQGAAGQPAQGQQQEKPAWKSPLTEDDLFDVLDPANPKASPLTKGAVIKANKVATSSPMGRATLELTAHAVGITGTHIAGVDGTIERARQFAKGAETPEDVIKNIDAYQRTHRKPEEQDLPNALREAMKAIIDGDDPVDAMQIMHEAALTKRRAEVEARATAEKERKAREAQEREAMYERQRQEKANRKAAARAAREEATEGTSAQYTEDPWGAAPTQKPRSMAGMAADAKKRQDAPVEDVEDIEETPVSEAPVQAAPAPKEEVTPAEPAPSVEPEAVGAEPAQEEAIKAASSSAMPSHTLSDGTVITLPERTMEKNRKEVTPAESPKGSTAESRPVEEKPAETLKVEQKKAPEPTPAPKAEEAPKEETKAPAKERKPESELLLGMANWLAKNSESLTLTDAVKKWQDYQKGIGDREEGELIPFPKEWHSTFKYKPDSVAAKEQAKADADHEKRAQRAAKELAAKEGGFKNKGKTEKPVEATPAPKPEEKPAETPKEEAPKPSPVETKAPETPAKEEPSAAVAVRAPEPPVASAPSSAPVSRAQTKANEILANTENAELTTGTPRQQMVKRQQKVLPYLQKFAVEFERKNNRLPYRDEMRAEMVRVGAAEKIVVPDKLGKWVTDGVRQLFVSAYSPAWEAAQKHKDRNAHEIATDTQAQENTANENAQTEAKVSKDRKSFLDTIQAPLTAAEQELPRHEVLRRRIVKFSKTVSAQSTAGEAIARELEDAPNPIPFDVMNDLAAALFKVFGNKDVAEKAVNFLNTEMEDVFSIPTELAEQLGRKKWSDELRTRLFKAVSDAYSRSRKERDKLLLEDTSNKNVFDKAKEENIKRWARVAHQGRARLTQLNAKLEILSNAAMDMTDAHSEEERKAAHAQALAHIFEVEREINRVEASVNDAEEMLDKLGIKKAELDAEIEKVDADDDGIAKDTVASGGAVTSGEHTAETYATGADGAALAKDIIGKLEKAAKKGDPHKAAEELAKKLPEMAKDLRNDAVSELYVQLFDKTSELFPDDDGSITSPILEAVAKLLEGVNTREATYYSKGAPALGNKADVEASLRAHPVLGKAASSLIDSGKVKIVDGLPPRPGVLGQFDPKTGVATIYARNVSPANATGVLLHEVGVHMANDGSPLMTKAMNQAVEIANGADPIAARVRERMGNAGLLENGRVPVSQREEAMAYLVEEAAKSQPKSALARWWSSVKSAIKAWFLKNTKFSPRLTEQDFVNIAKANARAMAKGNDPRPRGGKPMNSIASRAKDAADFFRKTRAVKTSKENKSAFSAVDKIIHSVSDNARGLKPLTLSLLMTRDLGALAKRYIDEKGKPSLVDAYMDAKHAQEDMRTQIASAAVDVGNGYRKHSEESQKKMNSAITDILLSGVWPYQSSRFPDKTKYDEYRAKQKKSHTKEFAVSEAAWDSLDASEKKTVRSMFDYYVDLQAQNRAAIAKTIEGQYKEVIDKASTEEEKKALETERNNNIKLMQKELPSGAAPYIPLRRFGDHMVVVKSREYLALSKKAKALKRAIEKIHNGKPSEKNLAPYYKMLDEIDSMEKNSDDYQLEMYQSYAEAAARVRELKQELGEDAKNYEIEQTEKVAWIGSRAPRWSAIQTFLGSLKDSENADPRMTDSIRRLEQAAQFAYLRALSDDSAKKMKLKRRFVKGWHENMLDNFMDGARAQSITVSQLVYGPQINSALSNMVKATKEKGAAQRGEAVTYVNEFLRRHEQDMQDGGHKLASNVMAATSTWMLLTNPSFYIQNATQPYMMSAPWMAGRFGAAAYAKILEAHMLLMDATKGWNPFGEAGMKDIFKRLKDAKVEDDVLKALEVAREKGIVDIGISQDFGEIKTSSTNGAVKATKRAVEVLRDFARRQEIANRVSTYIAAYQMAKKDGDSEEAAQQYAEKCIVETHGDYSSFNAPRAFKANDVARIATQFKKFQLIQAGYYTKMIIAATTHTDPKVRQYAFRGLMWALATQMVCTGLRGMPLGTAVMTLAAAAMGAADGDDDNGEDPEERGRRYINDKFMSDVLFRGVFAGFGLDLSQKLGFAFDPLSTASALDITKGQQTVQDLALAAAGPAGGLVSRVCTGAQWLAEGELWKGMESLAPTGVANLAKAVRFGTEGITTRSGDRAMSPDDLDALTLFMQAIGLPTNKITDRTRIMGQLIQHEQDLKDKRAVVYKRFAEARRDHDYKGMKEARQEFKRINEVAKKLGFGTVSVGQLYKSANNQRQRERNATGGVITRRSNVNWVTRASNQ